MTPEEQMRAKVRNAFVFADPLTVEHIILWTGEGPRQRALVDNYGRVPYRCLDITPEHV